MLSVSEEGMSEQIKPVDMSHATLDLLLQVCRWFLDVNRDINEAENGWVNHDEDDSQYWLDIEWRDMCEQMMASVIARLDGKSCPHDWTFLADIKRHHCGLCGEWKTEKL
jgi:hypothetical protein